MTAFETAAGKVRSGANARSEARSLVAQMTLDEKLGCLDGDTPFWPGVSDMVNGGYNEHPWPAAHVDRLGIPGLDFADGPRGCVVGPSTAFPVSMARGASFDPELEQRIGQAIGAELRASGATYTGAVCMNLLRHPAWGRAQETYGEEPFHVGEMAAAFTEGLQRHVMACMKHFAANSMENARFQVDVVADERALHEVYLPHFKRVVQAGVASVMSSYNSLNGEWCGENETLLKRILRDEWGFDGFVITDFVFGLRDTTKSVVAGCNIEMPFRQQRAVSLSTALEAGELSLEDVEERVVETVATFLRFAAVYERRPQADVIACTAHRRLARESACASTVLLRNENSLLPLNPAKLKKLAILGPLADTPNLGDGGSSNVLQPEVTTPLAGLRSALPGIKIVHDPLDAEAARDADAVLIVVGYTKEDEGEFIHPSTTEKLTDLLPPPDHPIAGFPPGYQAAAPTAAVPELDEKLFSYGGDRSSLRLSDADETLIREVAARNSRVIVAVMGGSAVIMPWLEDVPVALMFWYPGMEGGAALAELLLGQREPGGRLPFAIPRDAGDLVDFDRDATRQPYGLLHGQWWLDSHGVAAHLPFGHGMGYTEFRIGKTGTTDTHVDVEIENTGPRPGRGVVFVFAAVPDSRYERPPRRLVGFAGAHLEPGERRGLQIAIDLGQLDLRIDGRWLREELPVRLFVGFDAARAAEIR